jgi:hypothetical protein
MGLTLAPGLVKSNVNFGVCAFVCCIKKPDDTNTQKTCFKKFFEGRSLS